MELTGRHYLYDVWTADTALLEHVAPWETLLVEAAEAGGAQILHRHFHQFEPCGVTGFLLLAESHLSVHTWPEHGLAALDLFTCGPLDADAIIAHLRRRLDPLRERLLTAARPSAAFQPDHRSEAGTDTRLTATLPFQS